ncbi:MAG: 30S ribosomal protein S17 [Candidatus Moranbacteria bacterium]|nr:30S ribosomal protein S17 [Candidatus Moranbacteria bacterium]
MAEEKKKKSSGKIIVKKKGTVVSDKNDKTAVVEVTDLKTHPIYQKKYRKTKRYKAHDEKNTCKVGDEVVIAQTKPISKDKCWEVTSN